MSEGCPPWAKNNNKKKKKKKKKMQNLRFWSCKSSSIAIELTFAPPQINNR